MGELHLEVIIDRLMREFNVHANVGKPMVAYCETIRERAEAEIKFVRQTGGRGQYAHVVLAVEPGEKGSHFTFEDQTKGGTVPKEYVPAVSRGARAALESGSFRAIRRWMWHVTLLDGSSHEVDSSDCAFETAGSMAVRKAVPNGSPVMLEPVMRVEVICPDEYTGEVMSDFTGRRGQLEGMEQQDRVQRIAHWFRWHRCSATRTTCGRVRRGVRRTAWSFRILNRCRPICECHYGTHGQYAPFCVTA